MLGIYSGLSIALLLTSVDQTVVATVLPNVVTDLGGLTDYSWTFIAYLLTSTVTIPIYGKLGDAYGRRPLFVVAIGTFIVSSALCGLATKHAGADRVSRAAGDRRRSSLAAHARDDRRDRATARARQVQRAARCRAASPA